MTGKFQRRLKASLVAAAAGLACWTLIPGSSLDKAALRMVARGFANPPFFISGGGSHATPWKLRTFASSGKTDSSKAPVIVSLGDDVEGFFQSSPPSPVDLAVILSNFQRLGAKKAATGAVLAWSAPDPIGLAALDKVIGRFESLVMAAPLSRGAVPEQMPVAFRNASIPVGNIHGDLTLLPVVNRIPLPGVILGGDNTAAGFQSLESEQTAKFVPLLARWEDRVVFAFPLLAVMHQLGHPLEAMEIRLGEYMKLSPQGPTVPIDPHGRLAFPLKATSPRAEVPAEALIDGDERLFPKTPAGPIILRDDRSASEPATRRFSKSLPGMIAAIGSNAGITSARAYHRPGVAWELGWILVMALSPFLLGGLASFPKNIVYLLLASATLVAQVIAAGSAWIWLPGIPILVALMIARTLQKSEEMSESPALPVPIIEPKPEPPPPPAPIAVAPSPPPPKAKKTSPKSTTRPQKKKR